MRQELVMTTNTTSFDTTSRTARPILRVGVAASVAASLANVGLAAIARAADVSLRVPADGDRIPVYAFAQVTLLWALVGVGLAAVLRRRAADPSRTFAVTTVVLTAVSLVPPFLVDADLSTALVLCATHVLAAAIVIPVLAVRLPRVRATRR
jgi:MYXO-CTERM domain-containing protein